MDVAVQAEEPRAAEGEAVRRSAAVEAEIELAAWRAAEGVVEDGVHVGKGDRSAARDHEDVRIEALAPGGDRGRLRAAAGGGRERARDPDDGVDGRSRAPAGEGESKSSGQVGPVGCRGRGRAREHQEGPGQRRCPHAAGQRLNPRSRAKTMAWARVHTPILSNTFET